MLELIYILFLLIVINFYLRWRKGDAYSTIEKFMLSLIIIFFLFLVFYFMAIWFGDHITKMMSPLFNVVFALTMSLIMPLVMTEVVLAVYTSFIRKKKK
jgi:hypothetical protein